MSDERDSFAIERARKAAAFAAKKMRPQLPLSLSIAGALAVGGLVLAAHSGAASHALERMYRFADARSSQAAAVSLSGIGHRIFEFLCPLFGDCPAEAPLAPQAPSAQPRPAAAPPARAATTTAAVFATETPRPAAPAPSAAPARASPPAPSAAQAIIERIVQREADASAFDARLAALEQSLIIRMNQLAAVRTHQSERAADNVADQISRATTITALDTGVLTGKITNAIDTASAAIASLTATELVATNATTTNLHVSGSASLNGDLTVSGTLTANILNVQGVSSAGALVGPFVTATSSSATSTFAGGFSVAGESILATTTVNGTLTVNGNTYVSEGGQLTVGDKIIAPGEIGLGTSTPAGKLAIQSTDADQTALLIRGASGQASPLLDIFSGSDQSLLHLAANGNVGIGTTTPGSTLTVNGNSISAVAFTKSSGAPAFNFDTANSRLKVHGTTPYIQLIDGANASSQIKQNGAALQFLVNDGSVTGMHIGQTGNVGIGTTSPLGKLHVYSSGSGGGVANVNADDLVIENNSQGGLSILTSNTGTGRIYFADPQDDDVGSIRYDHAQNVMDFWTNGARQMTISSTGNVGIGNIAPTDKLSILNSVANDTPAAGIVLSRYQASPTDMRAAGLFNYYDSAASKEVLAFGLSQAGTPNTIANAKMVIRNDGNVGIGTTSPWKMFSVAGDIIGTNITATGTIAVLASGGGRTLNVSYTGGQGRVLTSGTDDLVLGANNTAVIRIESDGNAPVEDSLVIDAGNVGIGTTSPSEKLHVVTSGYLGGITLSGSNTIGTSLLLDSTATGGRDYALFSTANGSSAGGGLFSIYDQTATQHRLVVNSTGNVGIGTTSPSDKLHVFGGNISIDSSSNHALFFKDAGVNEWHVSRYESNNSFNIVESGAAERLTILSGGNVGIGTTSPSRTLSVQGNSYISGTAFFGGALTATSTLTLSNYINGALATDASGNLYTFSTSTWSFASSTLLANSNTFSGNNRFTGGNLFLASTTIGNGTQTGGLTISGGATTTGNLIVQGSATSSVAAILTVGSNPNTNLPARSLIVRDYTASNQPVARFEYTSGTGAIEITGHSSSRSQINFGDITDLDLGRIIYNNSGNTGGANAMSFLTNNTERMRIDATGNVGIGTTSPAYKLDVYGSGRVYDNVYLASASNLQRTLQINNNGSNAYQSYDGTFTFKSSSNSAILNLQPITGNVGIGTTSPGYLLDIYTTGSANARVNGTTNQALWRAENTGGSSFFGTERSTAGSNLVGSLAYSTLVGNSTATALQFGTASNVRMTIDSSGNIGIGTTTPGAQLHVKASSGEVARFSDELSSDIYLSLGRTALGQLAGKINFNVPARRLDFGNHTNGAVLSIDTINGNVGIGTTTPVTPLDINGAGKFGTNYNRISTGALNVGDASARTTTTGSGTLVVENTNAVAGSIASILFATTETSAARRSQLSSGQDGNGSFFAISNRDNGAVYFEALRIDRSGNVGIGNTSPGVELDIGNSSEASDADLRLFTASTYSSKIRFREASDAFGFTLQYAGAGDRFGIIRNDNDATGVEALSILRTSGNVGIGTTSPSQKLEIAGSIYASNGDIMLSGSRVVKNTTDNLYLYSAVGKDIVFATDLGSEKARILNNGNVGIGLTGPAVPLGVNGAVRSDRIGAPTQYLELDGGGVAGPVLTAAGSNKALTIKNTSDGGIFFNTNGAGLALTVTNTGNVGIGTTNPNDAKVEVKGGTVCVDTDSNDSATSCIASESDERLKTNIQAISASTSLDIINALNPVSFDWRASDPAVLAHWPALGRYAGKEHSIGLIAQEVMPILPEALSLETVGDDEVQYYQLDYTKFVPHLIGAVKELWAKVQDLGQKIAALLQSDEAQNAKIQTLEARVQSLESQLGAAAAPSNNPPPQESSENDNSGSEDTESAETPSDEAAAEMEPPAENPGSESAEETERSEAESPPKSTVEPEPIIENPEPADAPASE